MATVYRVFGRPGCPYCQRAERMLAEDGQRVVAVDVTSSENWDRLLQWCRLVPDAPRDPATVPQIFACRADGGVTYVGGSDRLAAFLRRARDR